MGPLPCRTSQAKTLQHQAEGFVPGSKDCLLSLHPMESGALHGARPEASQAPRTSWIGLSSPPSSPRQVSWAGQSANTSLKMTPYAVTLLLPTSTHRETRDTCLGGKSVGSQEQIEAYLFFPKDFQLCQLLYLLQLPSNFLYSSCS